MPVLIQARSIALCVLHIVVVSACSTDEPDLGSLPVITLQVVNGTHYDLTLPVNESERMAGWLEFAEHPEWLYVSRHTAPVSSTFFCDETLPVSVAGVLEPRRLAPGESVDITYSPVRFDDGREVSTIDGAKYCVEPSAVPEGRYDMRVCARRASYPCNPDAQALVRECVEVPLEISSDAVTARVVFKQALFEHTESFCSDG